MASILILSHPRDGHAYAVAETLRRKGVGVTFWQTADFPTRSNESLLLERKRTKVRVRGPEIDLECPRFDSVWFRRPSQWVDPAELHPADVHFAEVECLDFRKAMYRLLAPSAFWVNPLSAQGADNKAIQQAAARQIGFITPDTLYSNDPREIRKFLQRNGGRIIYKPFRGFSWQRGDACWVPYSTTVTEEQLVEDRLLRMAPGIYQALVPKQYELRITVMGRSLFTARILSQQTETGRIDWRKALHEVSMERWEISRGLAKRCFELMHALGLVFGCFDFIVTPEGEHVFLEVNPAGQFLFVERYAGLPLLDAFCDFLIYARPDFDYGNRNPEVRLADVNVLVEHQLGESQDVHVVLPDEVVFETDSSA